MNEQLDNTKLTEVALESLQRFTAILNLTTMALDLLPVGELTKRSANLMAEVAHLSMDGRQAIDDAGVQP